MAFCNKCEQYVFKDKCTCKEFACFHPYYCMKDETKTVHARDAEEAAKQLIERMWQDDPSDPSNVDEIVEVIGHGKFKITAEATVDFYAEKL